MRPRDTSPEAWKVLMDLIRAMPPEVRLQRCIQLSDSICRAGEAGLREKFPQADEREIFLRAARQKLGPELFRTVYGDVLDGHGTA
jgi:hypothetical protein